MNKSLRMEAFIENLDTGSDDPAARSYLGYFLCFNRGDYYEAHDVLEHLWLHTPGPDHQFYKGLIQLAGAFVHLKLQHFHTAHRVHGRRLRPAARLFRLAVANLGPFAPAHLRLPVDKAINLAHSSLSLLESSHYSENPWSPTYLPQLTLMPADDLRQPRDSSPQHGRQKA